MVFNPSGPTRVFTDHFTDHFFSSFFCLARSSRVGDLNKNTRTPHARSCTAPQSNTVPAKGQQKTLKSNIYKREVVSVARPLSRLAPHTHTWDKTFEPIRMLKSCCLDTMKNNSCIISGATNESPRPPNLIVLYTLITATAPFYSTQAMVEPTSVSQNNGTSYISSLATIYNCNVRGK